MHYGASISYAYVNTRANLLELPCRVACTLSTTPLYLSEKPYRREVDLLYWDEHFALITSFSGFLSYLSDHRGRKFICRQCFGRHNTQQALDTHKPYSNRIDQANQVYLLPDEGRDIPFKNVAIFRSVP